MTGEYAQTDRFRGARIHLCDLAGLEIRDCEVSGLKIVDCEGSDVYLGGDFERLVVNDVDVTMYVEAELDRQHPARLLAREATSPDDYRAAWDAIETLWEATLDRARLLPEAKLHERFDGEWSLVETQRHLLFASDAWLGNALLEDEAPYHPLGFPAGGMPAEATAKLGLTLEATPTLNDVLAPRLLRMATMRRVVEGLTEAELDRTCGRKPAEPYPDEEYVVRRCLKVVLKEEAEHHRYALRDLAVLEAGERSECGSPCGHESAILDVADRSPYVVGLSGGIVSTHDVLRETQPNSVPAQITCSRTVCFWPCPRFVDTL